MENKKSFMSKLSLFGILCGVLLLSSCTKAYKLVPSESSQGKEHGDGRDLDVVKENLRSVRVYDEWETSAMFDVLWMSDHTRRSYVDQYCARRGKSAADKESMVGGELDKNRETISFYILADVRDPFHPELDDKNAAWTIYLDAYGKKIMPSSIKKIGIEELAPELLTLFGHKYRRPKFKKPYLVEFPIKDLQESIQTKKPFMMVLSSVARQCEIGWQGGHPVLVKEIKNVSSKQKGRKRVKDEDYYWL
ncbi:hypothetical protein KKA53_03930 [Candidatus Dependentiae bacterium]|nr:hypothetical protein [Candidatus Dependentiae bacterium]